MIHEVLEWIALGVDLVAVTVMVIAFAIAMIRFAPALFRASTDTVVTIQMVRCELGTYLVFALELMIVSDLVHSVISRTLEDLYLLGGVVVMRTVIAWFLNKEIQELRE